MKQNNVSVTNFSFNNATSAFQSTVTLVPGLNTFVLTSVNACGTDVETITVNYQNCIAPVITVLTPTSNGTTVNSASFNLSALILNSNNGQGITLTINGRTITNFSFNNATSAFQSTLNLIPGLNTIVLTSVNACGTDSKTITIIYEEPVVEDPMINICHHPPGNPENTQTLQIPLSAWPAHQAHGDALGACPEQNNNDGGSNGNSNGGGNGNANGEGNNASQSGGGSPKVNLEPVIKENVGTGKTIVEDPIEKPTETKPVEETTPAPSKIGGGKGGK